VDVANFGLRAKEPASNPTHTLVAFLARFACCSLRLLLASLAARFALDHMLVFLTPPPLHSLTCRINGIVNNIEAARERTRRNVLGMNCAEGSEIVRISNETRVSASEQK